MLSCISLLCEDWYLLVVLSIWISLLGPGNYPGPLTTLYFWDVLHYLPLPFFFCFFALHFGHKPFLRTGLFFVPHSKHSPHSLGISHLLSVLLLMCCATLSPSIAALQCPYLCQLQLDSTH